MIMVYNIIYAHSLTNLVLVNEKSLQKEYEDFYFSLIYNIYYCEVIPKDNNLYNY